MSEPKSSSIITKTGDVKAEGDSGLQSENRSTDTDDDSTEGRKDVDERGFGLHGSNTFFYMQGVQSDLTNNILSKEDLKFRIQKKKEQLPEQWKRSQESIEKRPKGWRDSTPRRVGKNSKKYDYEIRVEDGKLKKRQRLSDEDKSAYQEKIVANFRANLGDGGRWWYQMYGECYIHGMMDGEAMAHQNNAGISETIFEIR